MLFTKSLMADSVSYSRLQIRKEEVLSRGDLTEAEWCLLKDLLRPERNRKAWPAHHNRTIVNGILRRFRIGPTIRRRQYFGAWSWSHSSSDLVW